MTLRDLLAQGLITPGAGCLRTVYKGTAYDADLGPSGVIHFQGQFFAQPSAFSLYTKRLTQPERMADDGWRSVTFKGVPLHTLKSKATAAGGGEGKGAKEPGPPATAPSSAPRPRGPAASAPKAKPAPQSQPVLLESAQVPPEVTEYAKARPQRDRQAPQRLVPGPAPGPDGDLRLVNAEPYRESAGPQPYRVLLHPAAAALMDAHAHLSTAEIIGFLGGHFDASTKLVTICRALPARTLVARDAAVEVELDPAVMPHILEACEKDGLRVVGWYHSHPVFATQPSLRDVANQGAYQRLFDGCPFVGAIVGPYCDAAPSDLAQAGHPPWASDVRLFHVEHDAGAQGGGWPRQLAMSPLPCPPVDEDAAPHVRPAAPQGHLVADLAAAAQQCSASLLRVDLDSVWKDGLTKRAKLRACITYRLEPWARQLPGGAGQLVDDCIAAIDTAWAA